MPRFLNTAGLNNALEELLKNARREILLISPYIKLHPTIVQLLRERNQQGVKITVVCRAQDLQQPLPEFIDTCLDLPRLHAKCFLSERSGIVTSMNLHEASQRNNSEMGFLVRNSWVDKGLYRNIREEAQRLRAASTPATDDWQPPDHPLVEGNEYTRDDLGRRFGFDHAHGAGINRGKHGELVLFNSNPQINFDLPSGDVDYCGQETGPPPQELKYGNRHLYDCWEDPSKAIHMFRRNLGDARYRYAGQYELVQEPALDVERRRYRFLLRKRIFR